MDEDLKIKFRQWIEENIDEYLDFTPRTAAYSCDVNGLADALAKEFGTVMAARLIGGYIGH